MYFFFFSLRSMTLFIRMKKCLELKSAIDGRAVYENISHNYVAK